MRTLEIMKYLNFKLNAIDARTPRQCPLHPLRKLLRLLRLNFQPYLKEITLPDDQNYQHAQGFLYGGS